MKAKPARKTPAKPKKAAALTPAEIEAMKADIRAETLSVPAIAKKHGVTAATVTNYAAAMKRAEMAAKLQADWPTDSGMQTKRAYSHLCELVASCRPHQAKELAQALSVVGGMVLTFDGRASSITATQNTNTGVDFSKYTVEELETLMRVQRTIEGRAAPKEELAYDPANPVVYSDTAPDGIDRGEKPFTPYTPPEVEE